MARLPTKKAGLHGETRTNRDLIRDERVDRPRRTPADMMENFRNPSLNWEAEVPTRVRFSSKAAGRITSRGGVRAEGKK